MEVCNDAAADPAVDMNDEDCTVQLTDDQNCLNAETRPFTKMHVEFDNLSYWVQNGKGKFIYVQPLNLFKYHCAEKVLQFTVTITVLSFHGNVT